MNRKPTYYSATQIRNNKAIQTIRICAADLPYLRETAQMAPRCVWSIESNVRPGIIAMVIK